MTEARGQAQTNRDDVSEAGRGGEENGGIERLEEKSRVSLTDEIIAVTDFHY